MSQLGRKTDVPDISETGNTDSSERVRVDKVGRIVVPARFRKTLGLEPGETAIVKLEGNTLRVHSIRAAVKEAQTLMRKKNPTKRSAVDELIAERRVEAARE